MANKNEVGQCKLCLESHPLEKSHIIPSFAGKYLKATSATGYLRDAINPNVRRQDLHTERLLCRSCEALFSTFEAYFASECFPAVQHDDFSELRYDERLLKFAVSLSWRVLTSSWHEVVPTVAQFGNKMSKQREEWRRYLLGQIAHPGSEHHLFVFAGVPTALPSEQHEKYLHYMLRGIDATAAVSRTSVAVYTKMIRSIFYSPIQPKRLTTWTNTRIHAGTGTLRAPQKIAMSGFADFLDSRVLEAYAKDISDAQNKKIAETMMSDLERVANSESLKVEAAARRLREQNMRP